MKLDTCFVCGNDLHLCWEGDPAQYDGTIFKAGGNYGSGVFDPLGDGGHLLISICDSCMTERAPRVVLQRTVVAPPTYEHLPWTSPWLDGTE